MCLILSTSHLCEHKTLTPIDRPCQYFLNHFARNRWASPVKCPYRYYTHARDGKVCQGCTTEFGHPYADRGSDGIGEIDRLRRERMSRRESARRESMRRESVRRERARSPERGGTISRVFRRLARWFLS
ncbi:hypothetical protein VF21_02602 [Pseudogymnoascus sp. 05NY08]|nr:hypothetical protein VF21_02602 [Pseudogymnoascus sp. 05NY08]